MTSSPPICFTGTQKADNPNRYRKSHRIEMHRSADQYLADLEAKEALNKLEQARKAKGPCLLTRYMKLLGKGLDMMYSAVHIRP